MQLFPYLLIIALTCTTNTSFCGDTTKSKPKSTNIFIDSSIAYDPQKLEQRRKSLIDRMLLLNLQKQLNNKKAQHSRSKSS
jgi:hypothetical protein